MNFQRQDKKDEYRYMYDVKNLKIWKEETEQKDLSSFFAKTDIKKLNLCPRTYNCLKRAGCNVISDILLIINEKDEGGLRKIRSLGTRSEKEIMDNLERICRKSDCIFEKK